MKDFKNNLLKRNEIIFTLESEKNPGLVGAIEAVVKKLKTHEENVVIKSVKSGFGRREFVIEAFVYNSREDKDMIERKPKVKKTSEGAK